MQSGSEAMPITEIVERNGEVRRVPRERRECRQTSTSSKLVTTPAVPIPIHVPIPTPFMAGFRHTLQSTGVKTPRLPARSPNLNAYGERFVRTIKSECLAHMIPLSERHLCIVVKELTGHYHLERKYQGRENRLIDNTREGFGRNNASKDNPHSDSGMSQSPPPPIGVASDRVQSRAMSARRFASANRQFPARLTELASRADVFLCRAIGQQFDGGGGCDETQSIPCWRTAKERHHA
jgi:hypothetical protein